MADNMLIDGLIKFCDEKSKNIKLKAEPRVFNEIKQALEELKAIKQWKSDVMEGFCKYDASSFEEIVVNARAKAIDEFARQFKENLNQEFPSNYESTRPYFSLENARLIVDDVAEQMKAGGIDG